jgi:hypothetical protein
MHASLRRSFCEQRRLYPCGCRTVLRDAANGEGAYGNPESPARTLLATVSLSRPRDLQWARKGNKIVFPIGSKITAYVGAPSEPLPPTSGPPTTGG